MTYFYISFATDEGFRGATVVKGDDAEDALVEASFRGLNPGGEAAIFQVPAGAESNPDMRAMVNRLVTKDELIAQGGKRVADLPEDLREAVYDASDVVCENCNITGKSV